MSAELSFWSSLLLLLLLCMNYVRHERLKAQVTQVLEHDKESTCQRRTAPFERTPAELDTVSIEHEQTTPGLEWHEEFTCFHCHQVFLLTQHPLAAVCPHCGVRQIDVAI